MGKRKSWTSIFLDQIFGHNKRPFKEKKKKPHVILDHEGNQLFYIDRKGKKHRYKKYRP